MERQSFEYELQYQAECSLESKDLDFNSLLPQLPGFKWVNLVEASEKWNNSGDAQGG